MDPVSLTTTVITLAGAVCKSYEQISKIVTLVRNAPKELEAIQARAESVYSLVVNLRRALEESAIRKVIEKDELALSHVMALDAPLKAVECTLDEVVDKLRKQYRPTADGKRYKVRWQYLLTTSDWELLQTRLNSHIQVLSASMQGLNTLNVLRVLGGAPSKDPARTLRTYAESVIEAATRQDHTRVGQRTSSPTPSASSDPGASPLPFDNRRLLAKRKRRLQRELLLAARAGEYLDVEILLGEGVEMDWTEQNEGKTALHFAAQYGHLRVAERLLEAGADIEARSDAFGDDWVIRTEKGRTPLIWAAAGRDCPRTQERMCRLLLEKGADANARNIYARTALQEAAMSVRFQNIDPRATMEVLLKHGAFVNAYDMNSWTALTECGHYGRLDVGEFLLANGAQVDGKPGVDDPATASNPDLGGKPHETPLVVCAEWSWNEDLICLLLEHGADLEGRNKEGKTMAQLASDAKRGIVLDALERADQRRLSERFGADGQGIGTTPTDPTDSVSATGAIADLNNPSLKHPRTF